jgi:trans-aconitate methyltransferase
MSQKTHWENVYKTKNTNEVSWTQKVPQTSLDFIKSFNVEKSAPIIDIGGGESNLVDFLIEEGFTDITVLDISEEALEKAKKRLGLKANNVKWIVTDITTFTPDRQYKVWHDRATFHFLTTNSEIQTYLSIAKMAINGYIAIGTFSENGPQKCSGLEIKQYSETQLQTVFSNEFEKIECVNENHTTPFNTVQNFTFCSFKNR